METLPRDVDEKIAREITSFIHREAELLEDRRYIEWLDLLADDVEYIVHVRITRSKSELPRLSEISDKRYFMYENKYSLEMRVKRLYTEYAWAEDPPSRVRYHINRIVVESGEKPDEVRAKYNVFLVRSIADEPDYEFISYTRIDTFRRVNGSWKLCKRIVIPDSSVMTLRYISIFL
jgi:ethylbenzene dioxygenase beta subunit